jgi:hypothetical protein
MISIEKFGYLINSTVRQNRQQVTISTEEAQQLLMDIVVLQNRVIEAQQTAISALEKATQPVSGSMQVDSGKF